MPEYILIKEGTLFLEGSFHRKDILIKNSVIKEISPEIPIKKEYRVIKAKELTILPGFVDIHTHGGNLVDFNTASKEEVISVSHFFASKGVTSFYATLVTDSIDILKKQLDIISSVDTPNLRGIHLEGPFLSILYRGAMNEEYLKEPSIELFNEFQKSARGQIKIITLAPELPSSKQLIKELMVQGIVVSIGHSNATYEEAKESIEMGALSTTHIMNAMEMLHRHVPGIMTAALEADTYCEMICDGFHLHPALIRLLLKIKGTDKMIAVTDSLMAAGCIDGFYTLGKNTIVVENGDAKLLNGIRAGSTLTLDKALRNLEKFTKRPINELISLVSTNALEMLGLTKQRGKIKTNFIADITAINKNTEVVFTIANGQIMYSKDRNV